MQFILLDLAKGHATVTNVEFVGYLIISAPYAEELLLNPGKCACLLIDTEVIDRLQLEYKAYLNLQDIEHRCACFA